MKIKDGVIICAVIILIILHFYLPFVQDDNGLHSSFYAVKYTSIHWGFYYFYVMVLSLLISLITFIILCQKNNRTYYSKGGLLWFGCIIVMMIIGISLEKFLEANLGFHLKAYANPSGIFAVSLFSLPIIAVINLIGGASEIMTKNQKNLSNKKFEFYIKDKNILYKTTVYFYTRWYYVLIGKAKPQKIALTKKEIIVAIKGSYIIIPYNSIKSLSQ